LIHDQDPGTVVTPEDFTREQRAMAKAAEEFIEGEVLPKVEEIEEQTPGLMRDLLRQAGELGLLAADVPEEYGGLALDLVTSLLICEQTGRQGSFAVSHGAHTGIGTLPVVYFGTEEQKQKYLPKLANGEMIGAYALSEAGSGSDALSAKAKAVLNSAGTHYVLNGEKMWISNGGFADLFTLFAQVAGDQFTAFLVERNFPGVSVGVEEHKLGIKGSSTVRVILDDAQVPRENVLYEVGRGHVVALNILNIGRLKLAIGLLGAAKDVLNTSVQYAKERHQFGRPIADFGLIREKIGEMATRLFAAESAGYRTTGLIQTKYEATNDGDGSEGLPPRARDLEEYLIECAVMKVVASEMLDYVVDEAVQIHGGYGYTEDFPVARAYRDSRINRIFEGTNEINRLTVSGTLLRRAQRGRLPLIEAAQAAEKEALGYIPPSDAGTDLLSRARGWIRGAKKAVLLAAGSAVQRFGDRLSEEQEILGAVADIAIDLFAAESSLLRAEKARSQSGEKSTKPVAAAACLFASEAMDRIDLTLQRVLAVTTSGDDLRSRLAVLRKFTRRTPLNTIALRREVAAAVIDRERYPF